MDRARRPRSYLRRLASLITMLLPLLGGVASPALEAQSQFELLTENISAAAGTAVEVSVVVDAPSVTNGGSFSLCSDPALLTVNQVAVGGALAGMNSGAGPDVFNVFLFPDGYACGFVYSLLGFVILPAGNGQELGRAEYFVSNNASTGTVLPLQFCSLGSPPLDNIMVNGGYTFIPTTNDGSISVTSAVPLVDFIRGDTNADGAVTVTDGIVLFGELFGTLPTGPCPQSGDVNNDSARDLSDVITLFTSLLTGGPPFQPPFPDCGSDVSVLACQPTLICP